MPLELISPIRNHQYDFTALCDYYLHENKIWTRSRTPQIPRTFVRGNLIYDPRALNWHLFDGLGIPYGKSYQSILKTNEIIVEISVASGVLVAVSNLNKVFIYKPTVFTRPLYWEVLLGAPDVISANKLYLPHERREWTFSCSVTFKPDTRTIETIDPTEVNDHYEDGLGTCRKFGFTATIFVLLADGQRIVYWDTGLPASFSRGFLVPEGLQGQSISAAGSTVFLSAIDADGNLRFFTRLIDYEINGGCPGLPSTYINENPDPPVSADQNPVVPIGVGQIKLPLEGWREHCVDGFRANLTYKVSIHLTGPGNSARELRIQGVHVASGALGYYSKQIDDAVWQFYAAPVNSTVTRIAYSFNPQLGSPVKDYTGRMIDDNTHIEFELQLRGFHPFSTAEYPCYLAVTSVMDRTQTTLLRIHIVDGWALTHHKFAHEDLIGTIDGEHKSLMGTLVCTPEQIQMATVRQTALGQFLATHFLPFHGKTKTLRIIADNCMIMCKFKHGTQFFFFRQLTQEEFLSSFYMKKALNPELCAFPRSSEERERLLAMNEWTLKTIQKIFHSYWLDNLKFAFVSAAALMFQPLARGLLSIHPGSDIRIPNAVKDARPLLKSHRNISWTALIDAHPGYETAIKILKGRIKNLKG